MMKNNIQYKNLSQQDIVDFQCDDYGMINQLCKGDKETGADSEGSDFDYRKRRKNFFDSGAFFTFIKKRECFDHDDDPYLPFFPL